MQRITVCVRQILPHAGAIARAVACKTISLPSSSGIPDLRQPLFSHQVRPYSTSSTDSTAPPRLSLRGDSIAVRQQKVEAASGLKTGSLGMPDPAFVDVLDKLGENVVGGFILPASVAPGFVIDGKEISIPMSTEEPSVVAAASFGAKLIAKNGGFKTYPAEPIIIGQIQLIRPEASPSTPELVMEKLQSDDIERFLKAHALGEVAKLRSMTDRGGGFRDGFSVRKLTPRMLVLEFRLDVRDAMGANLVNMVAEALAPKVRELTEWDTNFRILSNNASQRITRATVMLSPASLAFGKWNGDIVAKNIALGSEFALHDENRAVTHNKGIMNGISALGLSTGQDTRALESAAHFHARHLGINPETGEKRYGPLATWTLNSEGNLIGEIEVPTPVGVVGRLPVAHPGVATNLRILSGDNITSENLSSAMAALGLAMNLSALRALGTEGISAGHMAQHDRFKQVVPPSESSKGSLK